MKLNRFRFTALVLCLLTVFTVASTALAAGIVGYGTVSVATSTVYSSTDRSTQLGYFSKDDVVGVEASSGSMYKVRLSSSSAATGYILKTDIGSTVRANVPSGKTMATMKTSQSTATAAPQTETQTETQTQSEAQTETVVATGVTSASASLFKNKNGSGRITVVSKGTAVDIYDNTGNYFKVKAKGQDGYMEKSKITINTASSSSSSSSGTSSAGATSSVSTIVGNVNVLPGSSTPLSAVSTALAAAKAKNSDTIGYIKINGTKISLPILHRPGSPFYYLTYDINKKKSSSAEVNSLYNVPVRNNTITAHNMRVSGTIFHELHHLQDRAVGKSKCSYSKCKSSSLSGYPNMASDAAARVWDVTLFGYNKWEVWAMYEVPKNEPKSTLTTNYNSLNSYSVAQRQSWINNQLKRSQVSFGTAISPDDVILTIYTCGDNYDSATAQSRLYFFLKAVK